MSNEKSILELAKEIQGEKDEKSGKLIELKYGHLGKLTQIANVLYDEMLKEIKRNGYSDLTLTMEASVHGINEIIKLNDIKE